MVERSGYVEEAYFTGNFIPLWGDSGRVEGFYNAHGDVTRQKIDDRRRKMLNMVSKPTQLYTTDTIGSHIIEALSTNPRDLPFAALYAVDDSLPGRESVRLTGSIGLPTTHKLAVQRACMNSEEGLIPLLRGAQKDTATIPVTEDFDGIEWAGFGQASSHVSAVSLWDAGHKIGFLVVGANPRRPIDGDHEALMRDLSKQLSSTIAFTISAEQSARREQRLEAQLADSERQIRYMAEHLDIGMEHVSLDGSVIWANEHFCTLIEHGRSPRPITHSVIEEDKAKAIDAWNLVARGEKIDPLELRLKRKYLPPSGDPVPATIILSAFPYIEHGETKSVMACTTDVSRLKWAEAWQARAAQEAQEAKRQQSEFTDAISHEVRNPLSAIFQLADSIASCLDDDRGCAPNTDTLFRILRDNIEAAKTILVCANHQKKIVDDVLTLSKMDFTLMTLSPTAVRPPDLAEGALKILQADLSSSEIDLDLIPDHSLKSLAIEWVLCDSLRVTQILINLLSNAIKFTKGEPCRKITMTYGASLSNPETILPNDIEWASRKHQHDQDITLGEDWGYGQPLYLTFLIHDTGPGMNREELDRIFQRFQQANPRTSIRYGGSGLGLFISHSLVEKQSGRIGVSSRQGGGSTFAFYIKARRDITTPDAIPQLTAQSHLPLTPPADIVGSPERTLSDLPYKVRSLSLRENSPLPPLSGPGSHFKYPNKGAYHILLVEDNIVNQRILRKQLMKAGCIVHVANHGLEALEFMRTTNRWKDKGVSGKPLDIVLVSDS